MSSWGLETFQKMLVEFSEKQIKTDFDCERPPRRFIDPGVMDTVQQHLHKNVTLAGKWLEESLSFVLNNVMQQ